MKTLYLAGGCFWGMQKYFDQFNGVLHTEVGYANGPEKAPTYEEVCNDSGHAETLKIDYDETKVSALELVRLFFMVIDPYSVNKQGGDEGIQYRTGVYYTSGDQLSEVRPAFIEIEKANDFEPLQVELRPLENFFSAEEYHQKYLEKNPGGYCHIPNRFFELNKK